MKISQSIRSASRALLHEAESRAKNKQLKSAAAILIVVQSDEDAELLSRAINAGLEKHAPSTSFELMIQPVIFSNEN